MKRFFFRPILILLIASIAGLLALLAQTVGETNEGSLLSWDETNQIYRFKWWGKAGRTYFIQTSEDLMTWNWVPIIEPGDDSIKEWGFTSTSDRFFVRLKYTDQPTTDPEGGDFDGDGMSNLAEVQAGRDPLLPPPAAPTSLVATLNEDGSWTFTWQDNSDNEQNFTVQIQDASGNWITLGTLGSDQTSFTLDAAAAAAGLNASSNFQVNANNASGSNSSNQTNPAPVPHYAVIDLHMAGYAWSAAYGLNNKGDVVGQQAAGPYYIAYAFRTFTSTPYLLGVRESAANSINDVGLTVGFEWEAGSPDRPTYFTALKWLSNGAPSVLSRNFSSAPGSQPFANAFGINAQGDIVGATGIPAYYGNLAVKWANGAGDPIYLWRTPYTPGEPEGQNPTWDGSTAFSINDSGSIVGETHTNGPDNFIWQAFMNSTQYAPKSFAYDINNEGLVVGQQNEYATIFGSTQNLGEGSASALNSTDPITGRPPQIVGYTSVPILWERKLLPTPPGDPPQYDPLYSGTPLQELLANPLQYTLTKANDINDHGMIAGSAIKLLNEDGTPVPTADQQLHAVLLVPANLKIAKSQSYDTVYVPEDREEVEGGYIPINADNDNGSAFKMVNGLSTRFPTTRDFDTAPIPHDDDELVHLKVEVPRGLPADWSAKLTANNPGRAQIKLWKDRKKAQAFELETWVTFTNLPQDLYVEGFKEGAAEREIELKLMIKVGSQEVDGDKIKLTVTPVVSDFYVQPVSGVSPYNQQPGYGLYATSSLSTPVITNGIVIDDSKKGELILIQELQMVPASPGIAAKKYDLTTPSAPPIGTWVHDFNGVNANRRLLDVTTPYNSEFPAYDQVVSGTPIRNGLTLIKRWRDVPSTGGEDYGFGDIEPSINPDDVLRFYHKYRFTIYLGWRYPDKSIYILALAGWTVNWSGEFRLISGYKVYFPDSDAGLIRTGFVRYNDDVEVGLPSTIASGFGFR